MKKAKGLRIESMDRIAVALERIADALEKQSAGGKSVMIDGNKMAESILLEIGRSKNQFGEPEVRIRSSPL